MATPSSMGTGRTTGSEETLAPPRTRLCGRVTRLARWNPYFEGTVISPETIFAL
jgi:hypothetical protein